MNGKLQLAPFAVPPQVGLPIATGGWVGEVAAIGGDDGGLVGGGATVGGRGPVPAQPSKLQDCGQFSLMNVTNCEQWRAEQHEGQHVQRAHSSKHV